LDEDVLLQMGAAWVSTGRINPIYVDNKVAINSYISFSTQNPSSCNVYTN